MAQGYEEKCADRDGRAVWESNRRGMCDIQFRPGSIWSTELDQRGQDSQYVSNGSGEAAPDE